MPDSPSHQKPQLAWSAPIAHAYGSTHLTQQPTSSPARFAAAHHGHYAPPVPTAPYPAPVPSQPHYQHIHHSDTRSLGVSPAMATYEPFIRAVEIALRPMFETQNNATFVRVGEMEARLSGHVNRLARMVERAHRAQLRTTDVVVGRLQRLEEMLGVPATGEEQYSSVWERLDAIDFEVSEILERTEVLPAPELKREPVVQPDVGIDLVSDTNNVQNKVYADAATDPWPAVQSTPIVSNPQAGPSRPHRYEHLYRETATSPVSSRSLPEHRLDLLASVDALDRVFNSRPNQIFHASSPFSDGRFSLEPLAPADWTAQANLPDPRRDINPEKQRSADPKDDVLYETVNPSVFHSPLQPPLLLRASLTPPEPAIKNFVPSLSSSRDSSVIRQLLSSDPGAITADITRPPSVSLDTQLVNLSPLNKAKADELSSPPSSISPLPPQFCPGIGTSPRRSESDLSSLTDLSDRSSLESEDEKQHPRSLTPALKLRLRLKPDSAVHERTNKIINTNRKRARSTARDNETTFASNRKRRKSRPPPKPRTAASRPAKRRRKSEAITSQNNVSKGRSKNKKTARDTLLQGAWPERTQGDGAFHRAFIQCDKCYLWYHWSCAGLNNDDRQSGGEECDFVCPPCVAHPADIPRRIKLEGDGKCLRPDCSEPGEDEFFVERIIGRRPRQDKHDGFLWLVKWTGYDVTEAGWTPDENMGDNAMLVQEFENAAQSENCSLENDTTVLLKEARDAGW